MLKQSLSFLILIALSACRPAEALPTIAALPTLKPVSVAEALPATQAPRITLTPFSTSTAESPSTPTPSLAASFTPSLVPTATITDTPTVTPTPLPLEIDFERVYPIALHLRAPLIAALNADRAALTTHRYTLTAYKEKDGWVKILLVPTRLIEENWQHAEDQSPDFVEVVGWQENGAWHMARIGSAEFVSLQARIPETFMSRAALPPLEGEYLFPWAKGQVWWAIQTWHDGNALDFQPVTGQRTNVLASESGWLREICGDGYQSFLEVKHADGRSTFYLHVTLPRRVRALLDHPIQRGQYLGELIGEANFATDCGHGLSRHLHFVTSDRTLAINGNTLEEIASVASCCAEPPMFVSANNKIDDFP